MPYTILRHAQDGAPSAVGEALRRLRPVGTSILAGVWYRVREAPLATIGRQLKTLIYAGLNEGRV